MTGLSFAGGNNIGGNFLIRFAQVVGIQAVPTPATGGPVTFYPNWGWREVYGTEGKKTYDENQTKPDDGSLWEITITCFLAGDTKENRQLLGELVNHRFVVEIEDNVGLLRRVGNKTENLELTYKQSNGSAPSDPRGYLLTFKGEMTSIPPIIN
jgi:hypothetical protein